MNLPVISAACVMAAVPVRFSAFTTVPKASTLACSSSWICKVEVSSLVLNVFVFFSFLLLLKQSLCLSHFFAD